MARLHSEFKFTGSIGNLSAYKVKGSDQIYLRTKGGASKEKVKNSPGMVNTRRNMAEFGGRSSAGKRIRFMLGRTKALGDFYISGEMIKILKPIQEMDAENDWGKRSILITKNPSLLQGFNLNETNPFDEIVKNPCSYNVSRESLRATIDIPALIPKINFFVPGKFQLFRFVAALGVMPDLFFSTPLYKPSLPDYNTLNPVHAETDWHYCEDGSPSSRLEVELTGPLPDDSCSLILSLGICFGTGGATKITQLKNCGAGKILAVV